MQNFSPLASKVKEDKEVTEGGRDGVTLAIQIFTAFVKTFQISSEIERVASGNMYKEQAWVEKLLKRLRNEADTQSQSIHKFLVDNLLAMHSDVLTSVGNLRKTLQELALKTDKTVRIRQIYNFIFV